MKYLFIKIVLLFLPIFSIAQTAPYSIDNNNCSVGGSGYGGSSFLTLGAGQIDSIRVISRATTDYPNDTLYIFAGNTTNSVSQIYKQSIGPISAPSNSLVMIRLKNPLHVNASTTYTFIISGFPICFGSDSYANGSYWNDQGEQTGSDVNFNLYIGQITVSGINSPTEITNNPIAYSAADRKIEVNVQENEESELVVVDLVGNIIISSKEKELTLPSTLTESFCLVKLQTKSQVYSQKIYVR
jgi:hypothetical protein